MSGDPHRPWPRPRGSWIMAQTWRDLLFAHWPVDGDAVEALLPEGLALDTFDGRAWLGVVPFRMTGIRFRFLPPLPGLSAFPECNVRTYVVRDGKPGVWFFGLEAAHRLAVATARRWFHLPYFHAEMSLEEGADGWIAYATRRTHEGAPEAEWRGRYRPTGPVARAAPGTLDHWLTERYCLYARKPDGTLLRGEIHHDPWPLQSAEAEIAVNALGPLPLPDEEPLLHFARRLDVVVWSVRRLSRG